MLMQKLIFMTALVIYDIILFSKTSQESDTQNIELVIELIPIAICIIGALG